MVIEIVLYSVALVALLVGSLTDLRTREVPDWISYGLMISGLGLRLLFSVSNFDWFILLEGIAGFLLFVAVGYFMYYTGQWGGGDSKLLMGLGGIIGLQFTTFPVLFIFFINLLLAGAVYGVVWIITLTVMHFIKIKSDLIKRVNEAKRLSHFFSLITSALVVLAVLLSRDLLMFITLIIAAAFPLLAFYLFLFVKSVEKIAMHKSVLPSQLTEGDWLVENVVVGGKHVAGPKDLGLSKKQIQKLIHLYKQKKIKKLIIKNGIPFVPSFLIGFVVTIIFGNWLLLFL